MFTYQNIIFCFSWEGSIPSSAPGLHLALHSALHVAANFTIFSFLELHNIPLKIYRKVTTNFHMQLKRENYSTHNYAGRIWEMGG